ncbi:MAG: SDR family oxidoreductase [Acidobacteria bacterium]|nr:SDR family oxidoreductase [Acidobacteriota bacterium]
MSISVDLSDKRILVVGASSGIGRTVAQMAVDSGAAVVGSARRADLLETLDAHSVVADVTLDGDPQRIVDVAVGHLSGLDAVVYCVGVSPLLTMADATAEDWSRVFAANVTGAAMVMSSAAPHLLASNGRAIALSSKSVRRPFPDLSLYSTSKIALDGLLRCLPVEFPGLLVTRVVVGNTAGTDFAGHWDSDRMEEALVKWVDSGVLGGGMMHADQVAEAVLVAVGSAGHLDDIAVIDTVGDDGSAP